MTAVERCRENERAHERGSGQNMKLLLDSSSSLLFSVLLAQLPLLTSALPAQSRRHPHSHADLDKLTNQTRHLQKLTHDLINDHELDSVIDHHRFKSLPAINGRANDLSSLELKTTLSQLHTDLKSFEHHFEWLNKVTKKHQHSTAPKLGEMISHIKSLINSLQRQMSRVDAQRNPVPSPSLPPHPTSHWEMDQSSQELLQRFRLYCDWATRAFLSLKSKTQA
ncbi:interleukin-11 [Astyanax mexicanus]|uniref:Interleukin-11 n=1 Tax=Astyanax mexicanus TaxID=7994 RepID=A0A8T2LWB9_ASTMX|nr:interleukin-11 [Astyanax mexicanus]